LVKASLLLVGPSVPVVAVEQPAAPPTHSAYEEPAGRSVRRTSAADRGVHLVENRVDKYEVGEQLCM